MKTGLLFDMDGTLLDTLGDLCNSVNYAMDQFGYPHRTLDDVRRFIGNGARQLIRLSMPEGETCVDAVLAVYQKHYKEHCNIETGPYAGIPEALQALKEYPMAIVSNKPDAATKALARIYFPGIYARGESADCPRKPAPDMLHKAMADIGADRCIYIGDSEVDVLTAQNAGAICCLSVTWGFRDEDTLRDTGAKYFCRTPAQLPAMIKEILHGK